MAGRSRHLERERGRVMTGIFWPLVVRYAPRPSTAPITTDTTTAPDTTAKAGGRSER
jgi:hypothetical protein